MGNTGAGAVEFYVPATFQFSTDEGRIERILVGLFHERGEPEVRTFTEDEVPEFYVPAMYQVSTDKGRIERFLETVFTDRSDTEAQPVPEAFADFFYLPASNPDGYRRHVEQNTAPLVPVTEASPGKGKLGGN
jgi:hypothetical protein